VKNKPDSQIMTVRLKTGLTLNSHGLSDCPAETPQAAKEKATAIRLKLNL
jgi:hypothetical protein